MGIGKTTITIATCHIQHIFNMMYDKILTSPGNHLTREQDPNAKCPTNQEMYQQFGFDCPCAKSNATSYVKKQLGVHGVIAPLGLLENWRKEWNACYADSEKKITKKSNPLQMKLVIGHTNARAADGNQLGDSRAIMIADVDLGDPDDRETVPTCTPKLSNSQVIFLTTSNSCTTQVVDRFRHMKRVTWTPEGEQKQKPNGDWYTTQPRPKQKDIPYTALVISSLWRDEAHKERLPTSKTITLFESPFFRHQQNRNLHLNIMSGTLLTSGPLDIASYLKRMVRPAWKHHPVLHEYSAKELIQLGEKWNKLVKEGKVDEVASKRVVEQLQPVIEATTLRFTPNSNFLGTGPVVTLPPNYYSEVACKHSEEWNARLLKHKEQEDEEYRQREGQRRQDYIRLHGNDKGYSPLVREGVTFHYRSRLFASFPYLMDITQDNKEAMKFTLQEWVENKKSWVGMEEPYRKYIKEIAASSGKLKRIKEKIDEWSSKIDGEGEPARLILSSFFLAGARIIYLVCISKP